jgi:hypothetical protein
MQWKLSEDGVHRSSALIYMVRQGKYGLALSSLQELLELFSADAVLGKGTPLDAGRADGSRVQMAAFLAGGIRLIAPNLDLLSALLAPDILRLWRSYLNTSWATFFKHDPILHLLQ